MVVAAIVIVSIPTSVPAQPGGEAGEYAGFRDGNVRDANGGHRRPMAVVELFTSQGCASCPPADEVVAGIVEAGTVSGGSGPVLVLSWHVDYWDYLGWPDPFGLELATERQRRYARSGSGGVYTPQIVVSGEYTASYAGSDRAVRDAVERAAAAAASRPTVAISLGPAVPTDGSLTLQYAIDGMPPGAEILFATVERGLVRDVTAGENRGRTLRHENVVRFATRTAREFGSVQLDLQADMDLDRSSVIALVQDRDGVAIHAGAERVISGSPASVSGVVRLPDGRSAGERNVLVCSDYICVPGRSDDRGTFTIGNIPAGEYKIRVDSTTADPAAEITLGSGEDLRVSRPLVVGP